MTFTPIVPKRGRPPHKDCVVAAREAPKVISFLLSADIAERLDLDVKHYVAIRYGTGADHGTIALARCRANDEARVPVYRVAQKIGFNINQRFLPDAQVPKRSVTLPHRWRGLSLIVDVSPLKGNSHDRSADVAA